LAGGITGGLLAARAGLKAAARNAVVGGVILACIEGLNIAISRVLMPSFEQQQAAAGLPIDLLDPPRDPLRISAAGSGVLWEASPTDYNQAHTGFDIDSVSKFDTYRDNWQEEDKKAESGSTEGKSWWKIW
jgi:hypothetical protein